VFFQPFGAARRVETGALRREVWSDFDGSKTVEKSSQTSPPIPNATTTSIFDKISLAVCEILKLAAISAGGGWFPLLWHGQQRSRVTLPTVQTPPPQNGNQPQSLTVPNPGQPRPDGCLSLPETMHPCTFRCVHPGAFRCHAPWMHLGAFRCHALIRSGMSEGAMYLDDFFQYFYGDLSTRCAGVIRALRGAQMQPRQLVIMGTKLLGSRSLAALAKSTQEITRRSEGTVRKSARAPAPK